MNYLIKTVIVEDITELNDIYYNLLVHEPDIEVVGQAHNKEEVFALLKEKDIDVILMDIELETQMAGVDYCRYISETYPLIKTIILTCNEEEKVILKAFEAGAKDYILKSNSLIEVVNTIKTVYSGNPSIHGYAANVIRKQLQDYSKQKKKLLKLTMTLTKLTSTELEILKLILKHYKQSEIAEERCIELVTVKAHVSNILRKFKASRCKQIVQDLVHSGLDTFVIDQIDNNFGI